ncbi:MAG: tetratricopeptide repeat protein, partial [Myxococcota bacterium]
EVRSALGSVYDRLGLREQARAELSRARELRPRDPRILNNLGVSYLLAEDPESAERLLREAVLRDPHDRAARNNLGLALGLLGRYEDALASFREAGSEQAAQNNLGYCYFLTDRFEDAVFHYERALMAEGPDDLTVLGNLAAARAEQAQPREPARLESTAVAESPAEPAVEKEPAADPAEATPEPTEPATAAASEEPSGEPTEQANAQPAGEPEPAAPAPE